MRFPSDSTKATSSVLIERWNIRCSACFLNISLFDMAALAPFQIQRQQAAEDFFVGGFGGVVGPAVGGGDGLVELLVREIEPGRALVVEVGQRALLEIGLMAGLGDRALGEAGFLLFRRDHPIDPLGRIEPVLAKLVQATGSGGDIGGDDLIGHARRRGAAGNGGCIAWREAGWEREGFEAGFGVVRRIVTDTMH